MPAAAANPACRWALITGMTMALGLGAVLPAQAQNPAKRGFEMSPVPLYLHGRNRDLVGTGSYLVIGIGGCNDCHTSPAYRPGGDPFAGQEKQVNADRFLAGGRVFIAEVPYPVALNGCVISRNLTPQEDGKPAGLTLAQFVHVMRTGQDPHDTNVPPRLLRVMPWPSHQEMTDRDLQAVYEYLSAIPPVPGVAQCP
jgi:hypothetical protein